MAVAGDVETPHEEDAGGGGDDEGGADPETPGEGGDAPPAMGDFQFVPEGERSRQGGAPLHLSGEESGDATVKLPHLDHIVIDVADFLRKGVKVLKRSWTLQRSPWMTRRLEEEIESL